MLQDSCEKNRHAYLIMAHKDDYTFTTLIKMLDNSKNDIFIHMDVKNKLYREKDIENLTKYAGVYHVKRTNVSWGGWSQINAELILLENALKQGTYSYYHLLSGEDLPIQKQEYIYQFFEENIGKEFVRFQSPDFQFQNRVKYYYFLQDKLGRKANSLILRKISILLQKLCRINRNAGIAFQKGSN